LFSSSILNPIHPALIIIYPAAIYIPSCQLSPLFNTIHCITTNPKIFPKFGEVAQNPKIVVSSSGDKTEYMKGSKLGHINEERKPFKLIKITNVEKANGPDKILIVNGTKQNYREQHNKAIHIVRTEFEGGKKTVNKLPTPIQNIINESTIPINTYST
jgi:hypothetical protein